MERILGILEQNARLSVEDIAAACQIYEKAKEQGLGVWLEI